VSHKSYSLSLGFFPRESMCGNSLFLKTILMHFSGFSGCIKQPRVFPFWIRLFRFSGLFLIETPCFPVSSLTGSERKKGRMLPLLPCLKTERITRVGVSQAELVIWNFALFLIFVRIPVWLQGFLSI